MAAIPNPQVIITTLISLERMHAVVIMLLNNDKKAVAACSERTILKNYWR